MGRFVLMLLGLTLASAQSGQAPSRVAALNEMAKRYTEYKDVLIAQLDAMDAFAIAYNLDQGEVWPLKESRRLERSIFRLWPKAAWVITSNRLSLTGSSGVANGSNWTTAESTLGGGVKALAGSDMPMRGLDVAWASTESRP